MEDHPTNAEGQASAAPGAADGADPDANARNGPAPDAAGESPADRPCPCCGQRDWRPRWEQFIVCGHCGLMTVARDYTDAELRRLYGEGYFHGEEYTDYLADKADYQRTLADHLRWVRRYVPPGGRILEIGCAYGYFLELIAELYPNSTGVDISEEAVAAARRAGLDARAGPFLEMDLPGGFDAVCLWDTLEHLRRPVATVARARGLLREGGWLLLTTGDFGAALPALQGRSWRQIHPPTHLFYFTRRALAAMCERLGLEVVTFATVTVNLRVRSALLNLRHLRGDSPVGLLAAAACRLLPGRLLESHVPLNLGDTVLLVARRRG